MNGSQSTTPTPAATSAAPKPSAATATSAPKPTAPRTLVDVAITLYEKRHAAEERFAKADAELKAWTKQLNATESASYDSRVESLKTLAKVAK